MDRLNSRHIMFIIWGITIISIKTNISVLLSLAGRDVWIAIAIASIIATFYLIYITKIMQRTNSFNIAQIYREALGNILGNLFLCVTMIEIILTLIECATIEAVSMHSNFFIETPSWYLIIFFTIPAIYTVKKGLPPLAVVTILVICGAILSGIILVALTAPYKDYRHLLPIMADNLNIKFIDAIILSLGFYGSLFLVFPFYKYVHDKNKLTKYSFIGFLFVIQMHIVSSISTIATFGPIRASNLLFPKLIQIQEITLLGFLESGELFVLFQIVGGWFVKYIISFFALRELIKAFHIDGNIIVYFVTFIVTVASIMISNESKYLDVVLHLYGNISFIIFVVMPFITLTIYKLKKRYLLKS